MNARVEHLVNVMVSITGYSMEQIMTRSRKEPLCYIRYCIFHVLGQEPGWTRSSIGEEFGMDHASVSHGIKKIEDILAIRAGYQKEIELYEDFVKALKPMSKKIYISLPITGRQADERREYAAEMIKHINQIMPSYEVVNPLENKLDYDVHWSKHMKVDIGMLIECDAIYMCHDWQWSHGCKLEHDIATSCGMDVYYQDNIWKAPIDK